jgi:hypothetical protein
MIVVLRFISLILIGIGLMLLGADLITSLEKHGAITVRSLEEVWNLTSRTNASAFNVWMQHALPSPVPGWVGAVLNLPAWALTGVLGVVLAFIFGRKAPEEI